MKTITLEEALKGAMKGPLAVIWGPKRYYLCGPQVTGKDCCCAETVGNDAAHLQDATLLAHCFNELPGLVEAVEKFIATYERLSGESFEDSAKENEALEAVALCAALRSATAVKMPIKSNEENKKLRASLKALLRIPIPDCEAYHHELKDRHGWDKVCPCVKRAAVARAKAHKLIEK